MYGKYTVNLKEQNYKDYVITHTQDESEEADEKEKSKRVKLLQTLGFKCDGDEDEPCDVSFSYKKDTKPDMSTYW